MSQGNFAGGSVLGLAEALTAPTMSDAEARELLRRWQQDKDRDAWDELITRHMRLAAFMARLFEHSGRLVGLDSEDLFSLACEILLTHASRFELHRVGVPFRSWMAMQLRFRIYMRIRSLRRHQRHEVGMEDEEMLDILAIPAPQGRDEVAVEPLIAAAPLAEQQREILRLRLLGMTTQEIADRLQMPFKVVQRQGLQAIKAIRRMLE